MEKIVYVFLLNIILLFPFFINAETYEKAEEISNSYMNRTDFKNSYNK